MTTPATHAASHEDSIAAAKLFVKGLEFELAKPLEPIAASPRPSMDDSDTEDGAEGRWFSLERALDLIVGVSSLRFFHCARKGGLISYVPIAHRQLPIRGTPPA